MSVAKGKAEVIFSASPGGSQLLKWTVENQSTEPWPLKTELRQIEGASDAQPSNAQLKSGESVELQYMFTLDAGCLDSIKLIKLGVFDAETGDRLGDPLTAICTVLKVQPTEPVRFSATDQKFIAELKKQNSFSNKTAVKLDFFREAEESDEEAKTQTKA